MLNRLFLKHNEAMMTFKHLRKQSIFQWRAFYKIKKTSKVNINVFQSNSIFLITVMNPVRDERRNEVHFQNKNFNIKNTLSLVEATS